MYTLPKLPPPAHHQQPLELRPNRTRDNTNARRPALLTNAVLLCVQQLRIQRAIGLFRMPMRIRHCSLRFCCLHASSPSSPFFVTEAPPSARKRECEQRYEDGGKEAGYVLPARDARFRLVRRRRRSQVIKRCTVVLFVSRYRLFCFYLKDKKRRTRKRRVVEGITKGQKRMCQNIRGRQIRTALDGWDASGAKRG